MSKKSFTLPFILLCIRLSRYSPAGLKTLNKSGISHLAPNSDRSAKNQSKARFSPSSSSNYRYIHYGVLAILALTFCFTGYFYNQPAQALYKKPVMNAKVDANINSLFKADFASDGSTSLVHASSSTELPNGNIVATWFAGSREGAKDVTIHSAVYNTDTMTWGNRRVLANPADTQHQLQRYIRKLGNPVITTDANNRLWLFYVSVSFGGWAASSINYTISDDMGENWTPSKRLIATPFFNLSTLVRGIPHIYQDGSIALPVYHEMAGKFGEILRISPEGKILSKQRLANGRQSLQPIIFPIDDTKASVLMRYSGKALPNRALIVSTDDAGENWSMPEKTSIENPNSALTGLVLDNGTFIAVANDTEDHRDRLSLLVSQDQGESWGVVHRFEDESQYRKQKPNGENYKKLLSVQLKRDGISTDQNILDSAENNMCGRLGCEFQFDYPYLTRTSNDDYHLLYTWNKAFTKHIYFNQKWLEERL